MGVYNRAMTGITIYVDWQYFLGILGALIGLAYYANGRLTKIETTVEWLKTILMEIKKEFDDGRAQPRGGPIRCVPSRHRHRANNHSSHRSSTTR
jgi:hypothetical protein